jgi:hypothetical protein
MLNMGFLIWQLVGVRFPGLYPAGQFEMKRLVSSGCYFLSGND